MDDEEKLKKAIRRGVKRLMPDARTLREQKLAFIDYATRPEQPLSKQPLPKIKLPKIGS